VIPRFSSMFKSIKNMFGFLFSKKSQNDPSKSDILAKICCVLFAIVLWLMVVSQATDLEQEMTYYAVPVTVSNSNILLEESGLSIVSETDYITNITVRGSRAKLSKFSGEDIVATVDVSGVTSAGDHNLEVHVSCPPSSGFSVVSQSLESVDISFDIVTSKSFDLEVNITNAQYDAQNYALGTPSVSPKSVTVTGPQRLLDTIETACVNLDLGKVDATIGFNRRVILLDVNGEEIDSPYLSLSDLYADGEVPFISVEEASKITEKTVSLTYDYKYGYYNSTNCTVNLDPQTVKIKGKESVLSKIDSINVCTIDETKITHNTVFETLIVLPDDVTLVDSVKTVTVTVIPSKDISSVSVPMTEINISGDKIASLDEAYLLTFRGKSDVLELIRSEEGAFSVSVDVSRVTEAGTYLLPVTVTISNSYLGVWCEYTEVYVNVQ